MPTSTVAEALQMGIEREKESQKLYSELAAMVATPNLSYAFSLLQKQEANHQEILERYLNRGLTDGALEPRTVIDYHIAEHLAQPQPSPNMPLQDIFVLAAKREQMSNEFYTALAAVHPEGLTKKLLLRLASEELGHKQKVETMYSEVAFPQTDGG